jgi:hypothetical protein
VTEQARREALVQEQAEVQEWGDLVGEEWAAPEPVQVRQENVCVQNAELSHLMRLEFPVTKRIVLNVGQRW